ncbi:MAG: SAM-dependent methyltransferase [Halobacteriovoraceae bacterium]|nr:SAM-dependent methyltransferase [Halobacteriovoraceae bacterium]|tara:strand:- start:3530 stop:4180 length:651 start_codon:yes stop_codon:yes gene_type:complete
MSRPNGVINENSYNLSPILYDIRGFFILTLAYRNSLITQVRFFGKNLTGKHLECAVGTGTFTLLCELYAKLFLKNKGYKIIGVDYSNALMKGARKRLKGSELLLEDLREMSFENESFDSVNLPNAFHTIDGMDKAMVEIYRVLRPNGILCLNVLLHPKDKLLDGISRKVNEMGMRSGILKRPYTEEETMKFLKSVGFQILYSKTVGNCAYIKCRKL